MPAVAELISEAELIELEKMLDGFDIAADTAEGESRPARIASYRITKLTDIVRRLIEEHRHGYEIEEKPDF